MYVIYVLYGKYVPVVLNVSYVLHVLDVHCLVSVRWTWEHENMYRIKKEG